VSEERGQPVAGPDPGAATRQQTATLPHGRPRPVGGAKPDWAAVGRVAVWLVPALIAFALGWWQIAARSFSEDEAATLAASRRPVGDLLRMLLHIDAVHGCYYILIHWMLFLGSSEAVVRFPSVLATAVAAAVLAMLGTRLAGPWAGLAAGLLYAVSPLSTLGAQTARPFAIAAALTTIATCRLVVLAETGARRDVAWYAVALILTGWTDILAMLVVVAHAVTLAAAPEWRARRRDFMIAVAVALLAVAPLAALDLSELGQIWRLQPPDARQLLAAGGLFAVFGLLASVALRRGRGGAAPPGPRALTLVAAPWLMLPPAILIVVSEISPMWQDRYLLFCLPALALLVVGAAARLPARLAAAALGLAVAGALAAQPLARPGTGGTDDLRAVSAMLARNARPGDAVVFQNRGRRLMKAAYPAGFAHLRDIALAAPAGSGLGRGWFGFDAASLYGQDVSQTVLHQRLEDIRRLWAVRYPTADPPGFFGATPAPHEFCAQRTWQFSGATVTLYRPCPAAGGSR
jgi:mannosyltransferase